MPQVEVTFDIDANGILNVSAKDKATGNEQKITITGSTNLTDSQIDEKVAEAKKFESEDKTRKEKVDTLNQADALIYSTDRYLKDFEGKVSEEMMTDIKTAHDALKEEIKTDDVEKIKKVMDDLNMKLQAAGQAMYEKSQQEQAAQDSAPPPGGDEAGSSAGEDPGSSGEEEYVDAEYKILDDE